MTANKGWTRAFDDPRIAVGRVVAAPCDQADAHPVALQSEAIAVVFYLMKPVGTGWHACRFGRETEIKALRHLA
jgi:hypothetical protein